MTIRPLKGTDEIGGSCIEISTVKTTILLDYGTPLNNESTPVVLDKPVDALLISHPHQDHFGEMVTMDTKTPVYCGKKSLELMNAARLFTGKALLQNSFVHFEAWKSFTVGDIVVTPFLVDHSAMDAYAFLIEAEGQTLLYSGDFRSNGRKSKLFDAMLKDPKLKNIDVLLMEGTMMERSHLDFPDERSVEDKIYETLTANEHLTFLVGSSQNIDRMVSAYRACKKAGKTLVVDIYTAWILEVASKDANIPNITWNDIKVIKEFGGRHYTTIKENEPFFGTFKKHLFVDVVSSEELAAHPSKYLVKMPASKMDALLKKAHLTDANILYSQWLGYLDEKHSDSKSVEIQQALKQNYHWVYAHTGGHADVESLKAFAHALTPKCIVPIHTEHKEKFQEYFAHVKVLEDGEILDCGDL